MSCSRAVVSSPAAGTEDQERPPEADDSPEPLVGGAVDLGAVATEFLVLGIDPYPRKPGRCLPRRRRVMSAKDPVPRPSRQKGGPIRPEQVPPRRRLA